MPVPENLAAFTAWCRDHVTGDEKGQAQIFLDRLFRAFGQPGCLDVGGSTEFRIRRDREDGGGTAFADYVWKPVVLVEMKRRGERLERHRPQAFQYWTRLVRRGVPQPDAQRFVLQMAPVLETDNGFEHTSSGGLPGREGQLSLTP